MEPWLWLETTTKKTALDGGKIFSAPSAPVPITGGPAEGVQSQLCNYGKGKTLTGFSFLDLLFGKRA